MCFKVVKIMIYKTDEQLKEIYRKAQVKADNEIRNPYKILFYLKDSNDIEFSDIMNFMQYHDTDALNKIRFLLEREIFIRLREKEECTIKDYYSDEPDDIGDYGEKLTIFDLELLKVKGYNGNILHNLYIPYSNGKTSQIDILFINKKGIFVIESKNYSGWIFGSESDMYWTVCDRSKKWKMYNPILQNNGHINTINYHLRGIPCFSVVIFSERCELKKINLYSFSIFLVFLLKFQKMLHFYEKHKYLLKLKLQIPFPWLEIDNLFLHHILVHRLCLNSQLY